MWKIVIQFVNGQKKEFTAEDSYQTHGDMLIWWLPNGKSYSVSSDNILDVEELDLNPDEEK